MTESTALVNYEEQLRRELAQLGDHMEAPGSNKISLGGKLFRMPSGETHPGPLRCVILDYTAVNMLYKGAYNPNVKAPPLCWALGKNPKELAPSANVPQPQHTDCTACPKNQWGTAANGKGRACKNQRRLMLTTPDFSAEPMTLYVSPGGLKLWDKYLRDLISDHSKMPIQVVTDITFDPNQAYPTLQFAFVDYHGKLEEAMRMRAKYQDIITREPDIKQPAAA